jgi:O-antigen ligase
MINISILGLVFFSALFGGITDPLSCGIFLTLNGLLLALLPAQSPLPKPILLTLPILLFGILSSFQQFLSVPFGIRLSQFPVSLESLVLLLAGWGWLLWLCTQPTGSHKRLFLLRTHGWFTAAVGILVLICQVRRWPFPFTVPEAYGIFPNTNHMSNWLAIGGILLAGTVYADIRREKFVPATFSFLSLAAIVTCLAANRSRGGLFIFLLGLLLWAAFQIWSGPNRRIGIILLAGVSLLATFLLFRGAKPLDRLLHPSGTPPAAIDTRAGPVLPGTEEDPGQTLDFRLRVQRDVLDLLSVHPWLGLGPGNFESLFPRFRTRSDFDQSLALHPESDWLWFAAEFGLPSLLLLLAGLVLLLRRAGPGRNADGWITRSAGLAAVLAFAVHSLADVPGHRPGTVWPILMVLGLICTRKREAEKQGPPPLWQNLFLRGLGGILILAGLVWTSGVLTRAPWPATVQAARVKAGTASLWAANEPEKALERIEGALRSVPYDPILRFLCGKALLFFEKSEPEARQQFAIQLWLQPNLLIVPLDQAQAWAEMRSGETEDAVAAYREALARSRFRLADNRGPEHVVEHMMRMSLSAPNLGPLILPFIQDRPALVSLYLSRLPPEKFQPALAALLAGNPELDGWKKDDIADLLIAWAQRGEAGSLLPVLEKKFAWWDAGWPVLAQLWAKGGRTKEAVQLVNKYLPPPTLPDDLVPANQAESRWYRSPRDYGAAYVLAESRRTKGDLVGARVVLEKITERPEAPAYFWWLRARVETEEGRFVPAWESLRKYLQRAVPQFPSV